MIRRDSIALLALLAVTTGCTISLSHDNAYAEAVNRYAATASAVQLGMSTEEVSSILGPSQQRLRALDQRPDERYLESGTEVLIRYYRSGWHEDGKLTDDEYTPYKFRDGQLVSIGWQALGQRRLIVIR